MSSKVKNTDFLKECMADALIQIMEHKELLKITVNEIAILAGVNRSTWFRNFNNKTEAITFKLMHSWKRWEKEHDIGEGHVYTIDNAKHFFEFNYENRRILKTIYNSGLGFVVYDAFFQIMKPQFGTNALESYETRFYSYGMFGLFEEWAKRDFEESPVQMTKVFTKMIKSARISGK